MDWAGYERFARCRVSDETARSYLSYLRRVDGLVGLTGGADAVLERWREAAPGHGVPAKSVANCASAIDLLRRYEQVHARRPATPCSQDQPAP